MANYEFPSSENKSTITSSTTTQSNKNPNASDAPLTNAEAKKQIDSVKRAIKEKAEKEEKEREKRRQERKEKLDKIWKDVKGGLSNVTDKVSDLGEDVSSNITQEVFGTGFFANQMNSVFGKTLRKISDSLKWIGSTISNAFSKMWKWMVDAVKKFRKIFSRNGLFGTIFIYFRWMRQKLTAGFSKLWKMLESIKLFSIIGKLIGGVGSFIKGSINVGGDLIKSLVSWIMGSAAGKAIINAFSSLASVIKSITLTSFLSALAKAFAITLPLTLSGDDASKYYISNATKKFQNGEISEEEYKKELSHWGTTPELQTESGKNNTNMLSETYKNESLRNQIWNDWIKQYPNYMKKVAKKGWFDSDSNKDGIMDNPSLSEFINVGEGIYKGDGGVYKKLLDDKIKEELKNKSTLKNTAGVSST